MPRANSIFVCSACGYESARWEGRCSGCAEWNTLVEELRAPARREMERRARGRAVTPVPLADVHAGKQRRLSTGIGELDAVLGGGLVPGSLVLIGGARGVAGEVMRVAKSRDVAVLLLGHGTKEGSLAGPRVLEHLVDCVLQFEGERERTYRTVRAVKNRFGSTNEAGVFEMRDDGLVEVLDASARFVGEATHAPGSVVLCAIEGSRPLLVEVQALVSNSELVPPRRVVSGLDRNRVALVLAVLARHAGIGLGAADVFVNVVGGVRADEPGADLAIALAVASAAKRDPLTSGSDGRPLACFGELGLTGELRTVGHPDRRLAEAAKFGLEPVVQPAAYGTQRAALEAVAMTGRPAA